MAKKTTVPPKKAPTQVDSTRDMVPGFGDAVKARMASAGVTVTALAAKMEASQPGLSRVLLGKRAPSLLFAFRLASALGVGLDVLLLEAARLAKK